MTNETKATILATLTSSEWAGVHFTERLSFDAIKELEREGLIRIDRKSGCGVSWECELTEEGIAFEEAHRTIHDPNGYPMYPSEV